MCQLRSTAQRQPQAQQQHVRVHAVRSLRGRVRALNRRRRVRCALVQRASNNSSARQTAASCRTARQKATSALLSHVTASSGAAPRSRSATASLRRAHARRRRRLSCAGGARRSVRTHRRCSAAMVLFRLAVQTSSARPTGRRHATPAGCGGRQAAAVSLRGARDLRFGNAPSMRRCATQCTRVRAARAPAELRSVQLRMAPQNSSPPVHPRRKRPSACVNLARTWRSSAAGADTRHGGGGDAFVHCSTLIADGCKRGKRTQRM